MEITIKIEINGFGLPEVKLVKAKPKNIYEGHPEYEKAENKRLLAAIKDCKDRIAAPDPLFDQLQPMKKAQAPDEIPEAPYTLTSLVEKHLSKKKGRPRKVYNAPEEIKKQEPQVGTEEALLGCQLNRSKFVVSNATFKGDISEAKKAYWEYRKSIAGTGTEYLTWPGWLCSVWNKK